jgi:hypothetical protein
MPTKIRIEYICKRCMYYAPNKQSLRAHLSRIKPCSVSSDEGQYIDVNILYEELGGIRQKKKDTICEFCNKQYASSQSLCTHRKKCKNREGIANIIDTGSKPFKALLKDVFREVMHEDGIAGHVVNVSRDLINNVNNVVVINAVGNENIDYMMHEFLTHCIMDMTNTGIHRFIKNVHMNPEHPENHNVRGKSKRQATIETYDGAKWSLNPATSVLDDLMQKGCKVLYRHYNANRGTDFNNEMLQAVIDKNMMDLTDMTKSRKSETYYKIRRNLFYMFFQDRPDDFVLVADPDNQDVVEPTLNAYAECEDCK